MARISSNEVSVCASNLCEPKAQASDCSKHCDVRGYLKYGRMSTETPPTCCPDLLFLSGRQSEESRLKGRGYSCLFQAEDDLPETSSYSWGYNKTLTLTHAKVCCSPVM